MRQLRSFAGMKVKRCSGMEVACKAADTILARSQPMVDVDDSSTAHRKIARVIDRCC